MGSGKSTVSRLVADLLNVPHGSFGNVVKKTARTMGHPEDRTFLQSVGEEMVNKDPKGLCTAVLAECNWRKGDSVVIDGIRHVRVLDCLRELVQPVKLVFILLTLIEKERVSRLKLRDQLTETDIQKHDLHSTEIQLGSTLTHHADIVLDSDLPPKELVQRITEQLSHLRHCD